MARQLWPSRANRDEVCEMCGYPFDVGQVIIEDVDTGEIFCSEDCAGHHEIWLYERRLDETPF